MSNIEIRRALTGPFPSLRIPFQRDGQIDYDALRALIDFCISAGSKTLMLTYGDSLFSLLTDDEIAEVTRVVVEHNAGRAMVIAADRMWATPKEVQFAKYVRELGADMLMVLPPDWAASCTVESLVKHYQAVAHEIPVMLVTNLFIPRGNDFGLTTVKALLEQIDGIVAVKDDVCGEFARKMTAMVSDRWPVVAGGQKQNHLDIHPYGAVGYLSTFITFKPQVAHQYWRAIESNDIPAATKIVREIDMPLFDYLINLPGSFDAGMHGISEILGHHGRWRREPYPSLTDQELDDLSSFLQHLCG